MSFQYAMLTTFLTFDSHLWIPAAMLDRKNTDIVQLTFDSDVL